MAIPVWRAVKGYEGLYSVSNTGQVKSLFRYKKVLKPNVKKRGYCTVELFKDGQSKRLLIHRLVAEAFIPNWFNYPQVNHIDEDKTNNNFDNLEWCDCQYNVNFGTARKRMIEKLSKPVLQFTKTGELVREYPSAREADQSGFNHSTIAKCCNGKQKYHKGFIWKYKQ